MYGLWLFSTSFCLFQFEWFVIHHDHVRFHRFLCPPWQKVQLESKELMAACLRKIPGLSKVKLIGIRRSLVITCQVEKHFELLIDTFLQSFVLLVVTLSEVNWLCRHCPINVLSHYISYQLCSFWVHNIVMQKVPLIKETSLHSILNGCILIFSCLLHEYIQMCLKSAMTGNTLNWRCWMTIIPPLPRISQSMMALIEIHSLLSSADAVWIWTEPHSLRLHIKLTIQKEVMNGAILQQVATQLLYILDKLHRSFIFIEGITYHDLGVISGCFSGVHSAKSAVQRLSARLRDRLVACSGSGQTEGHSQENVLLSGAVAAEA